jgi:hypothetical protein
MKESKIRTAAIRLLLVVTLAAMGGCSSGEDTEAAPSAGGAPKLGPDSPTDGPAAAPGQTGGEPAATGASLEVSRTREGNGGILAVAGEMTMEFDYSPPQGHCRASDGKLVARGIVIDDDQAGVSIDYATIVAPDTGRVVGTAFLLEVRKDGYIPWVAHVGTGLAGSVEDISHDMSPDGGVTLTVTGTIAGFHKNRAPTGTRKPFRLEASCELQAKR